MSFEPDAARSFAHRPRLRVWSSRADRAPGCAIGPTEWERLDGNANVPSGTRVEVRARTAASIVDLRTATWVGPFTARPTELALPPGPLGDEPILELEISLVSDGGACAPSVRDVTVQDNCPI